MTSFQWRNRGELVFMCGIEIDVVLVCGSKLTVFLCGGPNWLRFCVRAEITWFQYMDRFGFCVRAENELRFLLGSSGLWFLYGWPKLTWFQCGGWNFTWNQCRDEVDLVVVWMVEIGMISVWGDRNWLDFSVEIGIDLVFVWRSKMTCFSVWIEINSVFVSGHRTRLGIRVGSKLTWFQWWGRN